MSAGPAAERALGAARRSRVPTRLQARMRGHRVEAARLALPQRPIARLAQGEEPGGTGGGARGRGGVGAASNEGKEEGGENEAMARLDEVFRLSGIPTYTFVEPVRYDEIKVSLRTPGRCLVLEGPSGIGKSTTINKAVTSLGIQGSLMSLSARRRDDVELINALPDIEDIGTVIVDDFHRLPDETKQRLSDFMKVLADSETEKSKLVLIGINKAGQQLVRFAQDLGLRIDVFRLEANPVEKIHELITRGEEAL